MLTYYPGSRNTKLDTFSRLFTPDQPDPDPIPIMPSFCVVGVAAWPSEEHVQGALHSVMAPEEVPKDRLFIPDSVRSEVLQ